MKLVKMSLAAIVAAGALTSVASATPLEEAIKNVDVSGFARYRFDSTKVDANGNQGSDTKASHRFTSYVDFKTALDDNFFAVLGLRYDSKDVSGDHITGGQTQVGVNDAGAEDFGQTFNVRQFLLGYKAGNTTIQAGRQVLGTFFTDDMVGTGIKVLNTDITGLTLAAVAFDDLQNDPDIGSRGLVVNGSHTYQNNLYGVAAIGSYDPVSFQLWYAMLENVTDLYAIDVAVNFNATADLALGLHGQFGGSSIDSDFKKGTNNLADDATFWAIEAMAKAYGVDFRAGYVDLSADDKKVSVVSFEDQGSFIEAGEDLFDTYSFFYGDNHYWFGALGYTFDKFRVGIDYVNGKITKATSNGKVNAYEVVPRVSYAYSKKLKFQAFWSHYQIDEIDGKNDFKNDHFRFEAKYVF